MSCKLKNIVVFLRVLSDLIVLRNFGTKRRMVLKSKEKTKDQKKKDAEGPIYAAGESSDISKIWLR